MEQGAVWHPKRVKHWGLGRKGQDMTLLSSQLIQQAAHREQTEVSTRSMSKAWFSHRSHHFVFKGGCSNKFQHGEHVYLIICVFFFEGQVVWVLEVVTSQRGRKPTGTNLQCLKGDAQPGTTVAACRCKHPTESSYEHLTASSQGCLQ